jgi:hypothetical protein
MKTLGFSRPVRIDLGGGARSGRLHAAIPVGVFFTGWSLTATMTCWGEPLLRSVGFRIDRPMTTPGSSPPSVPPHELESVEPGLRTGRVPGSRRREERFLILGLDTDRPRAELHVDLDRGPLRRTSRRTVSWALGRDVSEED